MKPFLYFLVTSFLVCFIPASFAQETELITYQRFESRSLGLSVEFPAGARIRGGYDPGSLHLITDSKEQLLAATNTHGWKNDFLGADDPNGFTLSYRSQKMAAGMTVMVFDRAEVPDTLWHQLLMQEGNTLRKQVDSLIWYVPTQLELAVEKGNWSWRLAIWHGRQILLISGWQVQLRTHEPEAASLNPLRILNSLRFFGRNYSFMYSSAGQFQSIRVSEPVPEFRPEKQLQLAHNYQALQCLCSGKEDLVEATIGFEHDYSIQFSAAQADSFFSVHQAALADITCERPKVQVEIIGTDGGKYERFTDTKHGLAFVYPVPDSFSTRVMYSFVAPFFDSFSTGAVWSDGGKMRPFFTESMSVHFVIDGRDERSGITIYSVEDALSDDSALAEIFVSLNQIPYSPIPINIDWVKVGDWQVLMPELGFHYWSSSSAFVVQKGKNTYAMVCSHWSFPHLLCFLNHLEINGEGLEVRYDWKAQKIQELRLR